MVDDSGQNWWYPIGGWRSRKNGKLTAVDTNGYYWCSSTDREKAANSVHLTLGKDDVKLNSNNSRANSSLIRCVKSMKEQSASAASCSVVMLRSAPQATSSIMAL